MLVIDGGDCFAALAMTEKGHPFQDGLLLMINYE
jgi:hypothetical protein